MYNDIAKEKFDKLATSGHVVTLGIESSCDETACAIVLNGRTVIASTIATQIDIHQRFGGVVPEIASRNHTMAILEVIDETLKKAGMTFDDIDAIGVTYGAGLVGALLVGVTTAKSLAFAKNIPLVKVNHIEAHICSNYVQFPNLEPPFLAVVASGGHTMLVAVKDYNTFSSLGGTVDDAIGEAFDKVARLLGLPYPGGKSIDKLAQTGTANIQFVKTKKSVKDLRLSYSGLKTAVVNYCHNMRQKGEELNVPDICASFTVSAVEMLTDCAIKCAQDMSIKTLVLAGGVASNTYLRENLTSRGRRIGLEVLYPQIELCTDNAVMVATRTYYSVKSGLNLADLTLNAVSNLDI